MLAEKLPQGPGNEVPTFVFGERLSGRLNLDTTIDGRVELRHGGTVLRADHVEYNQTDTRTARADRDEFDGAANDDKVQLSTGLADSSHSLCDGVAKVLSDNWLRRLSTQFNCWTAVYRVCATAY